MNDFSRNILEEFVDEDLSDRNFPYSTSLVTNINGCLVRAFRLSAVGELGYDLHIPNQSCEKVFQAITKAGEFYKMKLAGFRAWYSLGCEKGIDTRYYSTNLYFFLFLDNFSLFLYENLRKFPRRLKNSIKHMPAKISNPNK